jgi:hypothetical protein
MVGDGTTTDRHTPTVVPAPAILGIGMAGQAGLVPDLQIRIYGASDDVRLTVQNGEQTCTVHLDGTIRCPLQV